MRVGVDQPGDRQAGGAVDHDRGRPLEPLRALLRADEDQRPAPAGDALGAGDRRRHPGYARAAR